MTEGRISTGHEPAWSPDGQRLVFDVEGSSEQMSPGLYIVNADGSNLTKIVSPDGPVEGAFPVWSPDGTRIAWHTNCDIMTIRPDGSDKVMVLEHHELSGAGDPEMCVNMPMWSPDSQRFAFATFTLEPAIDPSIPGPFEYRFQIVNADGTGLIQLASFNLANSRMAGMRVAWLPNGHQLAFEVTEAGETRRYQMNADGSGEMVAIESIPEAWYPWHWPQWDKGK
jgi:Tol biopolymer transport system component